MIGIPLTALGVALYIVLLPLAYVSTAIALGDWALQTWRSASAGRWAWRAGAAALVLLLLSQATRVPWLGGVVLALALLAGLGALALQLRRQPQARLTHTLFKPAASAYVAVPATPAHLLGDFA